MLQFFCFYSGSPFSKYRPRWEYYYSVFCPFHSRLLSLMEHISNWCIETSYLTSIAGCSSTNHFAYRVHNVKSTFTAEALAIGIALDELAHRSTQAIILTNSLSVLSALQATNLKSSIDILWLHNKIIRTADITSHLHFYWFPSYRVLPLNQKADSLAKGVKYSYVLKDWISPEYIIRAHKLEVKIRFDQSYNISKYIALHGNFPTVRQNFTWA